MDIDYHLPSARQDSLKAETPPKFAVEIAASVRYGWDRANHDQASFFLFAAQTITPNPYHLIR
jgi:hypothetical protein